MADLSQTLPGAADGAAAMTSDARLHMQPGLEDLGEASFYPFLILPAILLITPLGSYAPLAVTLGALLLVISIQLALRIPHLVLPAVFREPIAKTKIFRRILRKHLLRKADAMPERRRSGHWVTHPPFDILPRVLIGVVGMVAILGSGLPGLSMVLGVAALLLTLSLIFRSVLALLCGAATLSLSSLIPILSS